MIANPFTSLETYIGLGRVGSLVLAPDGESAVLTVTTLSRDRTRFVNSLWTVPTRGDRSDRAHPAGQRRERPRLTAAAGQAPQLCVLGRVVVCVLAGAVGDEQDVAAGNERRRTRDLGRETAGHAVAAGGHRPQRVDETGTVA
jgi:hypothetical protein